MYSAAIRGVLVLSAVGLAAAPLPSQAVEQAYTRSFYPYVQRFLTPLSNLVPFAGFDLLLLAGCGLVAWQVWQVAQRRRGGRWRGVGGALVRLATLGAAAYLMFLLAWGFNYRRPPLENQLDYEPARATPAALGDLARTAVDELNALHGPAHGEGWPALSAMGARLTAPFHRAQTAVGAPFPIVPGRAKRSLLGFYFRTAAIDGMIDPFLLEVLINHDVLPFERPFVLAHEWAHLAGYADEGEASFVAVLACLGGDAALQYSAWIFLGPLAWQGLPARERDEVLAGLAPGPRRDLAAVRARVGRAHEGVSRAAGRAYDRFLKANRVEEGIASYGTVVQLVLGVRLPDQDLPSGSTPSGVSGIRRRTGPGSSRSSSSSAIGGAAPCTTSGSLRC